MKLDKAKIPTVVANLVLNGDEDLKNSKIPKSIKVNVGGKTIGIIGVLYDKTHVSFAARMAYVNRVSIIYFNRK